MKKKFYQYIVKRSNQTVYKTNNYSYAVGVADDVKGIVIDVAARTVVYKYER